MTPKHVMNKAIHERNYIHKTTTQITTDSLLSYGHILNPVNFILGNYSNISEEIIIFCHHNTSTYLISPVPVSVTRHRNGKNIYMYI